MSDGIDARIPRARNLVEVENTPPEGPASKAKRSLGGAGGIFYFRALECFVTMSAGIHPPDTLPRPKGGGGGNVHLPWDLSWDGMGWDEMG